MSVDLFFERREAEEKGVKFEEVRANTTQCTPHCSSHYGDGVMDWGSCDCEGQTVEQVIGYAVTCPDGSTGFAMGFEFFQCKNINQEIRSWFLENINSSDLSY